MLKHPRPEPSTAIFQTATEQVITTMQTDPLCLEANFHINGNNRQEVRVTLTSQYLALTELGYFDRPFHYCAAIVF
jgi:serine/threonine protein kinase